MRLRRTVERHLSEPWRDPLHGPTVRAFEALQRLLGEQETRSLVLDSGCGTGAGTRVLAARHPGHVVIGIDRSAHRLASTVPGDTPHREGRCAWVRADLGTFWRLALRAGWRVHSHYLLYPNPWPKARHLVRRWHAHPAWPFILDLGGELVLRTNWPVYAAEFLESLRFSGVESARLAEVVYGEALTPFERKYRHSGHPLVEVRARLS